MESHYENNYGGAMRRLNAITEKLEALDLATAPGFRLNGLKREELIALNSTLLHELYFASLGGDGTRPTPAIREAIARDFGSFDRWRDEFLAIGYALGGGSGWVLLTYVPRDGRLINQYAAEHTQAVASGVLGGVAPERVGGGDGGARVGAPASLAAQHAQVDEAAQRPGSPETVVGAAAYGQAPVRIGVADARASDVDFDGCAHAAEDTFG